MSRNDLYSMGLCIADTLGKGKIFIRNAVMFFQKLMTSSLLWKKTLPRIRKFADT